MGAGRRYGPAKPAQCRMLAHRDAADGDPAAHGGGQARELTVTNSQGRGPPRREERCGPPSPAPTQKTTQYPPEHGMPLQQSAEVVHT
jgi:hypothetical protein